MHKTSAPVLAAIGAVVLGVALTACGGSTPAASTAPAQEAGAMVPATPGGLAPTSAQVSANLASEADIATALGAAGVSSPKRWAAEVVEYRPYLSNDPNLAKLRQNLAKYNPGQQTVDKIVSALRP